MKIINTYHLIITIFTFCTNQIKRLLIDFPRSPMPPHQLSDRVEEQEREAWGAKLFGRVYK